MTGPSRRFLLLLAVVGGLTACTKKADEPAVAAAASAAASAVPAAPAPRPAPLKAAWVYVGPVADAGATFSHDQGRKAVEAEFGDRVQTSFIERVPEGARAEGAIRDLAARGNTLIFATSPGYAESVLKVAAEFPEVRFEVASGDKTAVNVRAYGARYAEAAYAAGVIAGGMTKTHVLGFVGGVASTEVLRSINAFTLGAQSVNPKVRTKVAWVDGRFDPTKESDAAQRLIGSGADVLLQDTDSTAVLQAAERNGKYAFGWKSDMSAFAPKAHLASCVVDWGPYYKRATQAVIDGSWTAGPDAHGVKEVGISLVRIAEGVPADVKRQVDKLSDNLKNGTIGAFVGPVVDHEGVVRLAPGVAADPTWLDKMDFYVRGVDSKVPVPVRAGHSNRPRAP